MAEPFEPDFSRSDADMAELMRLSKLYRFDLFSYLRLLSEAGAPTLSADVDDVPAIPARGRVVRYQLSEGLGVILTALRARNLDTDEIETGSREGCFLAVSG